MCTSNSIQKSWQLSKPSDHDEAWKPPFPLKKLTIEYKILQKWVWNGFWVGPFWHFWLPTVKVRWHIFKKSLFDFIKEEVFFRDFENNLENINMFEKF